MNWDDAALRHGTDKASGSHGYMRHYERLLADRDVRSMVEIGVDRGLSLKTWEDVFPAETRIVGVELNPDLITQTFDRAEVVIGDGRDPNAMATLPGPFDFIVDDAYHHLAEIDAVLSVFAPRLAPDGIYAIEDTLVERWDWPACTHDVVALLPKHGLAVRELIRSDQHLVTGEGDHGPMTLVIAERQ